MNAREYAAPVFEKLTDRQLRDFMFFFADDNALARFESDMITNGYSKKRYKNFKEVMAELDGEEDDE